MFRKTNMRSFSVVAFFCSWLFFGPVFAQNAPSAPVGTVGYALWETSEGYKKAGIASLIKIRHIDQCYIVSLRHLLSPQNGFSKQVAPAEIPEFVRNINVDSFSGPPFDYFVTGLVLPGTSIDPLASPLDDLAVYQLRGKFPTDHALALAGQLPETGETVWLVNQIPGSNQVMHRAKVSSPDKDKWVTIQLDSPAATTDANGAPVLDAGGRVVGIYSHANKDSLGLGWVIPSTTILQVIDQATTAQTP
jgi:hypothetical protein